MGPPPVTPRSRLVTWISWGFVICGAVAVGYGLWALYGSGSRLALLDATEQGSTASIRFEPAMNPLRAVLHATYAPVGSTRSRYEVELVDPAGRSLWKKQGALGNKDDDASVMKVTSSLVVFDVAQPGDYGLRMQMINRGMDHLLEATIELRRNVVRVDTRITWGFGLAAVGCLIVNLVALRGQAWPYRPKEDTPKMAA